MTTIEDIRNIYREKINTDRRISIGLTIIASLSSLLVIASIIIYIITLFAVGFKASISEPPQTIGINQVASIIRILSLFGGIILIGIVFFILEIYVFYRWIDARNKHFNRSREFYKAVYEYLKDKTPEENKDRLYIFKGSVDSLYYLRRRDISSIAWAILITIFSLGMYLLMHITIDYFIHRRLEEETAYKLNDLFISMGLPKVDWREDYEEREVLLYALLTLLTLGIFQIYWFYTISKDQNQHFNNHSRFEEGVIANLEKI